MPQLKDKVEANAIKKMQPSGVSRRMLISMAGGSVALGAFPGACDGDDDDSSSSNSNGSTGSSPRSDEISTAMFGEGDLGILNHALTLSTRP